MHAAKSRHHQCSGNSYLNFTYSEEMQVISGEGFEATNRLLSQTCTRKQPPVATAASYNTTMSKDVIDKS